MSPDVKQVLLTWMVLLAGAGFWFIVMWLLYVGWFA